MFGTNTVQSTWANPQQNQQQQPQGAGFGQPAGFGTGAFGPTTAFGQPQQQQPANPMFGNLGTSTAGSSPFGGFGQSTPQPGTTASVFGAPKPTTAFGAFGTTPAFGNTPSTFGTTNAAGTSGQSLFSNTSTGNTFGAGGSIFGQKPATTGFGTTTTGQDGAVAPVTTGTAATPHSTFSEKDPSSTVILQYQAITAMPVYRGTSLEELRVQDYKQDRKTASTFGQTSFGAPAAPSATGIFGATTTQQPATSSIFGSGTTSAFGTNTPQPVANSFGGFGQQNQPTGGTGTNLFGGGSAFGQPSQPQPQPQQQPTAFGGFGQQSQQPNTSTNMFGGAGGYGQNKPATGFTGFGNTGSTFGTGTFGQPTNQPATGTTTTSLFGQPQQPNQGASTYGGFGTNTAAKPLFNQPPTTAGSNFSLFGNQQSQPQQGQQPQPTSLFGNTATGTTGGSLFGQPQQNQQPQPQQGTGLFGNTTAQPSGGLFGNTQGTGTGLFGNAQQSQTQQPSIAGGLFSSLRPAGTTGTGLFGGGTTFGQTGTTTTPATGTLGQPVGQSATNQPSTAFGTSLFGQQKPAAPSITTTTPAGGLGSGLFGASTLAMSTAAPSTQGTLMASIAEPIAVNLPIFSMLPPGPRAVTLDSQPKKKPGFFADVPTRSPVPRIQLGYTPANSKLRGFSAPPSASTLGGQNGSSALSLSLTNGRSSSLALSRNDGQYALGSSMGADMLLRSPSPALGSGGRQSVKKLILDKKVEPADLFSRAGSTRGSPGRVTFSPALSQAAREEVAWEKETAANSAQKPEASTATHLKAPNRFSAQSTLNLGQPPSSKGKGTPEEPSAPPQHGNYWVKPDLDALKNLSYDELLSFSGLVVGRVGYGEVQFLEPVDLTGLQKLGALLGELVRFDDKECSVYPDGDEADKPAPGSGLNVRARIVLVRCWTVDKATREAIKDEKDPRHAKHLKRLKSMKDTHFESFDMKEGKWTFTVDRF